jgi:hypothetical protein
MRVVAGVAQSSREETAGSNRAGSGTMPGYGDLSVRDAACSDGGTDDDDAADSKRVPVRECSAIAAARLALQGVFGMP